VQGISKKFIFKDFRFLKCQISILYFLSFSCSLNFPNYVTKLQIFQFRRFHNLIQYQSFWIISRNTHKAVESIFVGLQTRHPLPKNVEVVKWQLHAKVSWNIDVSCSRRSFPGFLFLPRFFSLLQIIHFRPELA
jgi:hypothetical protein